MSGAGVAPDISAQTKVTPKGGARGLGGLGAEVAAIKDATEKRSELITDEKGDLNDFHKQMADMQSKYTSAVDELKESTKPFQAPQQKNPAELFGSFAGIMAALSGLATRRPLTTSLNSLSASMNAISQGNAEAYDKSFKEWQVNSDYALKRFNAENDAYKFGFDLAKTNFDAGISYVQNVAKLIGDNVMENNLAVADFQRAEQLTIDRSSLVIKAMEAQSRMVPYNILQDSISDYRKANGGKSPDPDWVAKKWGDINMQGMGGKLGGRSFPALVAQLYMRAHPNATPEDLERFSLDYSQRQSASRTLGTRMAGISIGRAELNRLLPQAVIASDNLDRTQYPTVNAVIQAYQRGVGDPNLRKLAVALLGVKGAMGQVLARGGVVTDTVRHEVDEQFNTQDPSSVLQAAFDQLQIESGAVAGAFDDVQQQIEGTGPPTPSSTAKADPSWPPVTGHADGSKLRDAAGDVVATAKGGQWVPVRGIP